MPVYVGLRDVRYQTPGTWAVLGCRHCGHHRMCPIPSAKQLADAYRDYYTHVVQPDATIKGRAARWRSWYEAGRHAKHPRLLHYALARVSEWLHPGGWAELGRDVMNITCPQTGGFAIDVGSGDGTLVRSLRRLGWTAEGVETDQHAAAVASAAGLPVRLGTLADAGYADDVADLITMRHVIEHVEDPAELLHEAARVLRPGGRIVIVTPNAQSLGHRWFRESWFGLDVPRHLSLFSPRSLRMLMRGDFQHISVRTTAQGTRGVWAQSRNIRRNGVVDARPALQATAAQIPVQLLERSLTVVGFDIGEEIWLSAIRQETHPVS